MGDAGSFQQTEQRRRAGREANPRFAISIAIVEHVGVGGDGGLRRLRPAS